MNFGNLKRLVELNQAVTPHRMANGKELAYGAEVHPKSSKQQSWG